MDIGIHIGTLRTRAETVFKTLVFSPFNHLTWLTAQESFIVHNRSLNNSFLIYGTG